jgi:two-component system NarL family response regulator
MDVVGEASEGTEAVDRAIELAPDVVLMDVRLPGLSGIEATERIAKELPDAKVIMLTVSDDESDLYDAIRAGAAGYLLKEVPAEELAEAIRSVWAGHSRISPSMASKLLSEFAAMSRQVREEDEAAPHLTQREMDVLRLLSDGRSNRDIASQLFISENTVKNHVRNILEKLHLRSRMEAVVYAMRENLFEREPVPRRSRRSRT